MQRFLKVFGDKKCKVIGRIQVLALPGTPYYAKNWKMIVATAAREAEIYKSYQLDAVLIENVHDVPYVQECNLGAETVACLTRVSQTVREIMPKLVPCGVQVHACRNKEALAIAKATQLQFIRVENFNYGQVGDEGYTDACAGELLRYRKQIDAEDVLILTDVKTKYISNAITADVGLLETARAAKLFLSDGIVLTGTSASRLFQSKDLCNLTSKLKAPLIIDTGINMDNIGKFFKHAQAIIVGGQFQKGDDRREDINLHALVLFMTQICVQRRCRLLKINDT